MGKLHNLPCYIARYKAIGNGMAVPCLEWIGRRIAMVEARQVLEVAA